MNVARFLLAAVMGLLLIVHAAPATGDNNTVVAASADDICPLLVGAEAPSLQLTTADGAAFDLNAAFTEKPTLLIFYRGGWCPFCNLHLAELATIEADLRQMGYQIIAISADRPARLKESMARHKMAYTLLSDSSAAAARAFGLAFKVDDASVDRLKGHDMDIEQAAGRDHHVLPVPAVYIVDTDGIIGFAYVNPNYKVRLSAEVLKAVARALLP